MLKVRGKNAHAGLPTGPALPCLMWWAVPPLSSLASIQFSYWLVYIHLLPMACLILMMISPLSSIHISDWLVYLQALPMACLILVMSSPAPSQVSTSLIGWFCAWSWWWAVPPPLKYLHLWLVGLPAGPANGVPDPGDEQSHPPLQDPRLPGAHPSSHTHPGKRTHIILVKEHLFILFYFIKMVGELTRVS
jgi:hypothetical protein